MKLVFTNVEQNEAPKSSINFEEVGVSVGLRISSGSEDGAYVKVETTHAARSNEFKLKYEYWKQSTSFLSVNNYDNPYYDGIINNGRVYLPYIYDDLRKGELDLIYALERIFPEKVPYSGFMPKRIARLLWLRILYTQKMYY